MRPLHIGLLVIGAALAGGVAVKMTQQQPAPAAVAGVAPPVAPVPKVIAPEPKPSPVPDTVTAAPPPVYVAPPKPAPTKALRINEPNPALVTPPVPLQPPVAYEPPPPAIPAPPSPAPAPAPEPAAAPAPTPRQVILRTGTSLQVRLNESISSERNVAGDTFSASLAEPLIVDGLEIAERGARVTGRVIDAQRAGRLSGTSLLELGISSVTTSDGQRIALSTEPWAKKGDSSAGDNMAKIGGGAAIGAIIGAIAGGGKGAAIGAGVGGAAGTGTAVATGGKPVSVPSETVIRFRLASSVTVTERL